LCCAACLLLQMLTVPTQSCWAPSSTCWE
jgi:hypothetical protein